MPSVPSLKSGKLLLKPAVLRARQTKKKYLGEFSYELKLAHQIAPTGAYGIRRLLRHGIDCTAIAWNQAAGNSPSVIPYTCDDTIHSKA